MSDLAAPAGYLSLIRENTSFRRLWVGNVISLFGDWFNTIALYALILNLTGSEFALGAVFITKMLPMGLASPLAGVLVDRFDRRKTMIVSDILRACIVLGFLFIDEPSEVFLIYLITAAQVVVGSVFRPAQNASIPNVIRKQDLVTANTIMSATWSVMLALGAALGGFAAEVFGLKAVFILDSASYLLSAWFIYRATIPTTLAEGPRPSLIRSAHREVLEGWRYLQAHPAIRRMATAKAFWAISGGGLVYMLALVGDAISPEHQAASIGVLFAARGVGTAIGPIAARKLFLDERHWVTVVGSCMALTGVGYVLLGFVPWTWVVAIPVMLAHIAGGSNWVLSTVLLQKRSEDRFRGRVFANEWLFVMGMETMSILAASLVLELGLLSLRNTVLGFGTLAILIGLFWMFWAVPAEKNDYLTGKVPNL
jgi:MFS family permease